MSNEESSIAQPSPTTRQFGVMANLCAIGSLLMCFSQFALTAMLSFIGVQSDTAGTQAVHVQAVLMWILAALAIAGLSRDRRQHGAGAPLVMAIAGLVVMIVTLYVHYHWSALTLAYILLVASVLLNQTSGVRRLYQEIKLQSVELARWNRTLRERVDEEVKKNAELATLRRFLSPQIAEFVTEEGIEGVLASRRRRIAVVFCDLRGFTQFSDSLEPEESMELLQAYHRLLGKLVNEYEGTIDHRAGDGIMVIFNDPYPVAEPVRRALEMSLTMRDQVQSLLERWRRFSDQLGFGVGIAYGYATLGVVGDEGRFDYTANGNVVNLAARLCDEALAGQIIVSEMAVAEIEKDVRGTRVEGLALKGFRDRITAYSIDGLDDNEDRGR
jgi:class 3 adenylate cyclase